MKVPRTTKSLFLWVGPHEKQLALSGLNLASRGIVLADKLWAVPTFLVRSAHAYNYLSPLIRLVYPFHEVLHRIELAKLSFANNVEACMYNTAQAINSTLDVMIILGYALTSALPKKNLRKIYPFMTPLSHASLVISTVCTLWKFYFVSRTEKQLANLQETSPSPSLFSAAQSCVYKPIAVEMVNKSPIAWVTVKENLTTQKQDARNGFGQAAMFLIHQFVTRRFPDSTIVAIMNFVLHAWFLKLEFSTYLTQKKQVKKYILNVANQFITQHMQKIFRTVLSIKF